MSTTLLIFGNRDFIDYDKFKVACDNALSVLNKVDVQLVGFDDTGVGAMVKKYSEDNNIPLVVEKAEWHRLGGQPCLIKYDKFGKAYNALAGIIRSKNALSKLKREDIILAFWDGECNYTYKTIQLAREFGLATFKLVQI